MTAPADGTARPAATSEATLRRLELRVLRKLDGLLHGDYLGLLPGPGTEHAEGRPYQPGDDVRRIDWNLTARTDAPHVRDSVADRELVTWLVVDGSASLDFGTARCEKRDLATAAVAAFGFLTARSGNRTGALLFGPAGYRVVPARQGRESVLALLHAMDQRPRAVTGETDLAGALARTAGLARRRGLVVVVSDFLDDADWGTPLRALARRHDVVAAHLVDPRELELPPVGVVTFADPETGARREVQTSDRRLRARFAAAAGEQQDRIVRTIRRSGAAPLPLSTDRDWLLDVARFADRRRRRR